MLQFIPIALAAPSLMLADVDAQEARDAIERGLAFLENDVAKWREERECSTCHHGIMTVWAYSEAKSRGYAVAPETVAETVAWAKGRFLERIDRPRDTRPGWSMVSTPAIYLAVMAQSVPEQDAVSAAELERIADHIIRHQETDGSWAWSSAPPINRPPPFFESDEVATRLASMALRPHDSKEHSASHDSREKAAAWLAKTEPADTTQAAALRLLMKVRGGDPAEHVESEIVEFVKRRNADGGWGQLADLPSDAYATGQALYVLSLAGVENTREEIRRGVAFLVANQREDGSWPMTSRAHPGATPYENPVPITYFGSAWAMLGLMRCVPKPATEEGQAGPATPAEQYRALVAEYEEAMAALSKVESDDDRRRIADRLRGYPLRFLELAEKNPEDPVAVDALIQAVSIVNTTAFPSGGRDSPAGRALALLAREHLRSDKLGPLCQRLSFGFREEYDEFLRVVLEKNPHMEVQALACEALAHFLNNRLQRVELIDAQPETGTRYRDLFGEDYIERLKRQDRATAAGEIETLYERAAEEYANVKLPEGGTVGEKAEAELFRIRHLAIGREAPEIEGEDQDGRRFKLSEYRGKVVLLYFWDQF